MTMQVDDGGQGLEERACGQLIDCEAAAEEVAGLPSSAMSQLAVDRRSVSEDPVEPEDGAVGRIAHEVQLAPRQDHEVAGQDPDRFSAAVDLEPGGEVGEEVEHRVAPGCHFEAPGRAHLRDAVKGAADAEPQEHLAQPVSIWEDAQRAHYIRMCSCEGTWRPTIQRKNHAPVSPRKANRLRSSLRVASKLPSVSRYFSKPRCSAVSCCITRAFETRASSFFRLRMTRVSSIRRSMSLVVMDATCSGSKPSKAVRIPGHLASTTRQLMPVWNMTRARASR